MNLRTQDHDLTILHADDPSRLYTRPQFAHDIYCGHNLYYDGQLVGTFDDATEAEEALLAVTVLGKYIKTVTVPGYSDSPEGSNYESARWEI